MPHVQNETILNKSSAHSPKVMGSINKKTIVELTVAQSKVKIVEFITLIGWFSDDFCEIARPHISKCFRSNSKLFILNFSNGIYFTNNFELEMNVLMTFQRQV